jgi:ligand-binding SRPBCC domain-containing protein
MRACLLVLLAVTGAAQAADDVSFVNEGVIPAPIDEVWKVFSTSDGYKTLGPALAEVDLEVGGVIRSRYRADGVLGDAETIENVIETLRKHFGPRAP